MDVAPSEEPMATSSPETGYTNAPRPLQNDMDCEEADSLDTAMSAPSIEAGTTAFNNVDEGHMKAPSGRIEDMFIPESKAVDMTDVTDLPASQSNHTQTAMRPQQPQTREVNMAEVNVNPQSQSHSKQDTSIDRQPTVKDVTMMDTNATSKPQSGREKSASKALQPPSASSGVPRNHGTPLNVSFTPPKTEGPSDSQNSSPPDTNLHPQKPSGFPSTPSHEPPRDTSSNKIAPGPLPQARKGPSSTSRKPSASDTLSHYRTSSPLQISSSRGLPRASASKGSSSGLLPQAHRGEVSPNAKTHFTTPSNNASPIPEDNAAALLASMRGSTSLQSPVVKAGFVSPPFNPFLNKSRQDAPSSQIPQASHGEASTILDKIRESSKPGAPTRPTATGSDSPRRSFISIKGFLPGGSPNDIDWTLSSQRAKADESAQHDGQGVKRSIPGLFQESGGSNDDLPSSPTPSAPAPLTPISPVSTPPTSLTPDHAPSDLSPDSFATSNPIPPTPSAPHVYRDMQSENVNSPRVIRPLPRDGRPSSTLTNVQRIMSGVNSGTTHGPASPAGNDASLAAPSPSPVSDTPQDRLASNNTATEQSGPSSANDASLASPSRPPMSHTPQDPLPTNDTATEQNGPSSLSGGQNWFEEFSSLLQQANKDIETTPSVGLPLRATSNARPHNLILQAYSFISSRRGIDVRASRAMDRPEIELYATNLLVHQTILKQDSLRQPAKQLRNHYR